MHHAVVAVNNSAQEQIDTTMSMEPIESNILGMITLDK